ncbi:MAG: hypothetical protein ACLQOO_15415 [Terriglobia bacterium]
MKGLMGHLNRQGRSVSAPVFLVLMLVLLALAACSPPTPQLTGSAAVYQNAKEMFGRGRFDKAIEISEDLSAKSPADAYTDKARVLRVVILSGDLNAYKDAAEAYDKGAEATKNPHFQAAYRTNRGNAFQTASARALGLGDTAKQIMDGGGFDKDFILDAPYPTTEGPLDVAAYQKVREGVWVEPEDQDAAMVDGTFKGIDDALAALVGDRAKAREGLKAGPVTLKGLDFAFYVGNQLAIGASVFDKKHSQNPLKLRALAGEADQIAKAIQATLKANPNPDYDKKLKKLQDQLKTTLKNI